MKTEFEREPGHIYKTVKDSQTEQVQILLNEHMNGFKRLFGGKLMEWIDIVAAVVARRHSNHNVTTVSVDRLHFQASAHVNDTVILVGRMTYVGKTSMEVRVDTFIEDLSGKRKRISCAYLGLVALDENEKPIEVPRLLPQTEEELQEWQAGKKRRALRKQRDQEQF